jgi:glycosyltransferase involved in cell wall biosynthesis
VKVNPLILVLDQKLPQPDRDAGSRSTFHLMRGLVAAGMDLKFWSVDRSYMARYAEQLAANGIEVLARDGQFYSINDLKAWLELNQLDLSWVLLNRPDVAENFLSVLGGRPSFKLAYYGHDLHFRRIEREAFVQYSDSDLLTQSQQMRMKEHWIWRQVDLVYYPAADEVREVQAWSDQASSPVLVKKLPVFAYTDDEMKNGITQRQPPESLRLLFVAGYAHRPNTDAALWFLRECWPLVRFRHPSAQLWLVGSNPPPEIEAFSSSSITVTGAISDSDLDEIYHSSRVAIAPIRHGAGVNGKIVEAMRHGLPCVCTPQSARGFEDYEIALRVESKPQDFARACRELLTDDNLWNNQVDAAKDYLKAHFSEHCLQEALEPLMS